MQVYIICSKRWVSRVNKNDSSPAFLNSNIENNLSTVDLMIRTMNFSLSDVYLIGGYHNKYMPQKQKCENNKYLIYHYYRINY